MRVRSLLVSAALVATALPMATAGLDGAAAASCTAPAMTFAASSASTLAPGVTALTGSTRTGTTKVGVHVVRVDLTKARLRVAGPGATGSARVQDILASLDDGVAAVNGDFFHIAADGVSVAPDGPIADEGQIVKAGAGEADALVVSNGIASVTQPRFGGGVTFTDVLTATASAVKAGPSATTAVAPATKTTTKPAPTKPKTAKKTKKKIKHKKKHRKSHHKAKPKRKKHKKHTVAHPVRRPAATVVVTPAPVAPAGTTSSLGASAAVSLDGLNDVDGRVGAVLITSRWGTSFVAPSIPAKDIEVVAANGVVTQVLSADDAVRPAPGQVAVVLSPAIAGAMPWLSKGDRIGVHGALSGPDGPADAAIGGNARLVGDDVVDPSCSLGSDTTRRPRVAVGTYDSGHSVVIAVTDGDSSTMPGLTLHELGSLMRSLGATGALNLDGGQSSTLRERTAGGWFEATMSDRSTERPVSDVLAVVTG
ncbi:MAG TPA: phosphodiester glycosidase family protein [Mycobacteriales bacterium]|nr:phosphodiester glycosidase family protein [Mycobacteriales bacterium]